MNRIEMVKSVGRFIISSSVTKVVKTVVKNNIPETMTKGQKMSIGVGTTVLGYMLGDKAVDYVEGKVDGTVNWFKEHVKIETKEKVVEFK